jgi:hypothetical protein
MPPGIPSRVPVASAAALDSLLADLGARLQRGGQLEAAERRRRCATGFPEIDRLLGGGIPRGRLCEIAGPASSGRTSLALGLLACATRGGECAAWIDAADAFDPASAEAAGADLERVLWVRAPKRRDALRSAERLLQTDGFALVAFDVDREALPATAALRLARLAAGTDAALVLLAAARCAGPSAELALELEPAAARFTGTPALLEGLEARVRLARSRTAPAGRSVAVRLAASGTHGCAASGTDG